MHGNIKLGKVTAVQQGLLFRPGPGENLLGQRRPVVRLMRLVTDEGDRTGKPLRTQELNGAHPAQPSTDNDHLFHATLPFRAHGLSGECLPVGGTRFAPMVSPRAAYVARSTIPGALPQSGRPTPHRVPAPPAHSGGIAQSRDSAGRLT